MSLREFLTKFAEVSARAGLSAASPGTAAGRPPISPRLRFRSDLKPVAEQSADRVRRFAEILAYRSLTGVISTWATPLFVRPIFCAAAGDRSRLRPRTAGPRSLILTWAERPFFRLVTFKLDPSGSVFEAAVRALGSKRSPLEVRCPRYALFVARLI